MRRRTSLLATLLRCIGLLFLAVLTILFGLIPFLLGAIAQGITPRRIPAYAVGPLAAGLFFVIWQFTGWVPLMIGTGRPIWPSVLLSLVLFVAFFGSGTALGRFCRSRSHGP